MRPWRSPAFHFLLAGATLFALERGRRGGEDARRVVVVPAAEVERLADEALRQTGRAPDEAELAARVSAWVDEELLVREARALGWHESDPVVQQRLIQNARFLANDAGADDAELLARAYALGLDESDLVVRRRLAARLRLAIAGAARAVEPGDAELAEFLEQHRERFREPARARLTQVFLSRDRRGERLAADAARLAEELRAEAAAPDAATARGDPSLLPTRLPPSSERELAARFGPGFGRAVLELEPDGWRGPVESSYGLHLVWVHERQAARDPGLEEVRDPVLAAWRAGREEEALRAALATLRSRADIRIEGGPWTRSTSAPRFATASPSSP